MMTRVLKPRVLGGVVCVLTLLVGGCKQPQDTKWQYFPDMADSPAVKAQSAPIDPPDDAVAVDALVYAKNAAEAEKTPFHNYLFPQGSFEKRVFIQGNMTVYEKAQFVEEGRALFQGFCSHCHGPQAKGDGTMVDVFPKSPDLTTDVYAQRKDGFFFHTITFGGAMMPPLGGSLSYEERYKVILYLRSLQGEVRLGPDDHDHSEPHSHDDGSHSHESSP